MIKLFNKDFLKISTEKLPRIQLAITSPPYNCNIDYDVYKDNLSYDEYMKWNKKWLLKMFEIMADDGRICINVPFTISPETKNKNGSWSNHPVASDFIRIIQESGFKYWRTVIWEKNIAENGTGWGSWKSASAPFMRDPSESIIVAYKKQWERLQNGESTITGPEFMSYTKNVWKIRPETHSAHPAAFPLELPYRCLKLFSFKNDWIFDPFMGCYDEQTEVLTHNGWKHFTDISDKDMILTRSINGVLEYQKPLKHYVYQYEGNMIQFKSRKFFVCCKGQRRF